MTELRRCMLEGLQRRIFSPSTIRGYIRTVRDFAAILHKAPDQLGVEEVRQFQLHMLRGPETDKRTRAEPDDGAALLFQEGPKRYDPEWYDMALTRTPKKLPVVLSPEEVEKLIEAAPNTRYRTILLLLYPTGLRRTEASQLKLADIDSKRMVIHVHERRLHTFLRSAILFRSFCFGLSRLVKGDRHSSPAASYLPSAAGLALALEMARKLERPPPNRRPEKLAGPRFSHNHLTSL